MTLDEQVRYRGTLQYWRLQYVTQLDTMVKSTMTETCSAVLRSRRNCSSDGAERTDDGRAFHARAAITGKARSSSVVRRVDSRPMTNVNVKALRRRRREPTSAVEWRVWARYDGAVPVHRCHLESYFKRPKSSSCFRWPATDITAHILQPSPRLRAHYASAGRRRRATLAYQQILRYP